MFRELINRFLTFVTSNGQQGTQNAMTEKQNGGQFVYLPVGAQFLCLVIFVDVDLVDLDVLYSFQSCPFFKFGGQFPAWTTFWPVHVNDHVRIRIRSNGRLEVMFRLDFFHFDQVFFYFVIKTSFFSILKNKTKKSGRKKKKMSYTHVLLCRNESNKTLSCPSVHQSIVSAIDHMRALCDSTVAALTEKDPTLTYAIRISSTGTERFIDQVSTSTTNNLILSNTFHY